jgi:poly(A) polymerase/tRNA nucleotidyltransferase (CCA-adding enzyme)
MEDTGVLDLVLPELSSCRGVQQKGYHDFDVLDHLLRSCDYSAENLELRLAALFHDVGKPASMTLDEQGIPSFHRHEEISAEMAENILQRLKFPRVVEKQVVHLIRYHMFHYEDSWSDAAVRRFVKNVGTEQVDRLLSLRVADQRGMSENTRLFGPPDAFRKRIESVLEKDTVLTVKDLAVDGNMLHETAGIPKGPVMGQVLDFLLESVIDDPAMNQEDILLTCARNFFTQHLQ